MTPREIVAELDRYVVGQAKAKRAVAIALRNRLRRQKLSPELADDVAPKNILMIGPTGVGKTEIARRLAKLAHSPFIKVEASKFTEVGYVGRDVEQIARDLMEVSIDMARERLRKDVRAKAELAAEDRVIDALCGANASERKTSCVVRASRLTNVDKNPHQKRHAPQTYPVNQHKSAATYLWVKVLGNPRDGQCSTDEQTAAMRVGAKVQMTRREIAAVTGGADPQQCCPRANSPTDGGQADAGDVESSCNKKNEQRPHNIELCLNGQRPRVLQ